MTGICALVASALLAAGDVGCGQIAPAADAGAPDAAADAPLVKCNSATIFDAPVPLGPSIDMPSDERDIRLTPDELVAYFWTRRKESIGDIFVASRSSITEPFGPAAEVPWTTDPSDGPVFPNVTPDQLEILGGCALLSPEYVCSASRASVTEPFSAPTQVRVGVGTSSTRFGNAPYLLDDGLEIYFDALFLPGSGIAMATRATRSDDFGAITRVPVDVGDAGDWAGSPVVTPDDLTLFFGRGLEPGIWTASRTSTDAPFTSLRELTEIESGFPSISDASPYPNWISPDGCRLYFTVSIPTDDAGGSETDIYVASRSP